MEPSLKSPLRILHLEDDPKDAELIHAVLETENIISQVTRVDTHADFVAELERGGIDLILADYTLPSFDGLSALKISLEKCPDIPFIFVSGTLGEEVAIEALKIGATDYLIKDRPSRMGPSVRRALSEVKERVARKRADEALQRSEAYLSEAQRLSNTGSFGWRVSTGEIIWSDETFRIFEWEPTTIPTVELIFRQTHPEDAAYVKQTIEGVSRDGKDFDFEHRLLMQDGSIKHVRVVGHALRDESGDIDFVGAVMDVTEQRQAKAALQKAFDEIKKSEDRLRTVIDTIPGMVWSGLPNGTFDFVNQPWLTYLGCSWEELSAQGGLRSVVHPDDLPGSDERWSTTRASGKHTDHELRMRRADGQYRWFLTRALPLRDDGGNIVRWYGTATDIDDRKRSEMLLAGEKRLLQMIVRGDSRALILDALCQLVEELASGSLSSILLLDPNTNCLRHGSAPSLPTKYVAAIDGAVIGPAAGSCGTAAYRKQPVIVSDIATDPLWVDYCDLALAHGLRACWSTPILSSGGNVLGTFAIYYREPRSPTQQDSNVIGQITYLASIALERAQAEQALQRQANLLEQAHDAIFIWEFPGTIVYWNRGSEQLYGFSKEEAIGRPSHELLHTEHPMPTTAFETALERDGEWAGELTQTTRDGRRIIVESRHLLVLEADGRRLVLETNRDITERKRAEEALRRSEHYLSEAQRLSHTGSWALSASSKIAAYWSDEDFRIWGFDPEQGLPDLEKVFKRIHPGDVKRVYEKSMKALREKTHYTDEFRIALSDGEVRHIHALAHPVFGANGEIAEYVGTHVDVTERKRAEEAVREQASLLNLTHDTIFVRGMDDAIKYWNRGAEELYGWTREEAIGQISHQLMQTIFPAPFEEIVEELKIAGRWEGVLMHTKRDGTQVTVASRLSLQRDERGVPRAILETNNDITERKRAEEEQKRSAEALRHAQNDLAHVSRVTTMGELTASLAHEVNQPITAAVTNAKTCLRWLTRDHPDLEEARAAAARIVKDGTRAGEIIKRVRLLFKKGIPERELVDINEVIREMIVLLRGELTRYSTYVRTELAADLPLVMADRVQLQQVFMNLMLNGIDAMKDMNSGGELTIKSQAADDGQLLITVSDTGVGLAPQQADQIFNAFFTTKPEGTGMGLSISRSIVESHDGRLWATPNENKGATLQFTLPSQAVSESYQSLGEGEKAV